MSDAGAVPFKQKLQGLVAPVAAADGAADGPGAAGAGVALPMPVPVVGSTGEVTFDLSYSPQAVEDDKFANFASLVELLEESASGISGDPGISNLKTVRAHKTTWKGVVSVTRFPGFSLDDVIGVTTHFRGGGLTAKFCSPGNVVCAARIPASYLCLST